MNSRMLLNAMFSFFVFLLILMPTVSLATNSPPENETKHLLEQINPTALWETLSTLTTKFPDRSSSHQTGVQAAMWIQWTLNQVAKQHQRDDVEIYTIDTKGVDTRHDNIPFSLIQPSVVLKIGRSEKPGIVVGTHFDTMACLSEGCVNEVGYPGADDNGSGTSILLELAKILLASDERFDKPIYLIFYAAEEKGCWGSQAVVNEFLRQHIPIDIILQLDQMGYEMNNDPTLYLESDHYLKPGQHAHVDHDETIAFQKLAEQFSGRTVKYSCTGNSDNESWVDMAHVKALRPLESDYCINGSRNNPNVHLPVDVIATVNLAHMTDYLKLAILFTTTYGDLVTSTRSHSSNMHSR